MKKIRKALSIAIIFMLIFSYTSMVYATDIKDVLLPMEVTDEFKEYMNLSKEEQEKVLVPRAFDLVDTKQETTNPFMYATMIGDSLESKYSLVDTIPENVVVRNQKKTELCWAFSTLSSLETNLALRNYRNKLQAKKYDFSETHMDYSLVQDFLNNEVNPNGIDRKPTTAANWHLATGYLTNGNGAVSEEQMPFNDDGRLIDINEIRNKTVVTEVYDTRDFPTYTSSDDLTEIKKELKSSIKLYGSISADIYGAQLISEYYNIHTGAIYCDDAQKCPVNHAVSIIGWDDNYDKNNFNQAHRPKNNGAWLIKNSWGTRYDVTFDEMRIALFAGYSQDCIELGYTEASMIPIDVLKSFFEPQGFIFEDNVAYVPLGNGGLMYISYEDVNVYSGLHLIEKAADSVSYKNIYNYDEKGVTSLLSLATKKIYLANVYSKKNANEEEYIDRIGIYAPETYTCKVYINPNSADKSISNMQLAKLETGDSETFDAGFHSIELLEPIKITGDNFVVALEIQGYRDNVLALGGEVKFPNTIFDSVKLEKAKCYVGMEEDKLKNESWIDLSTISTINSNLKDMDSCIRVYTTQEQKVRASLSEIKITTPPQKTTYTEGENFDKTGMVVTAYYSDGKSNEIIDYEISNGTNLKVGQTEVKVTYNGKEAVQKITVNKKESNTNQNPTNENPKDTTKPVESEPLCADFSKAKCNIKKFKARTNSNIVTVLIDVEIADINRKSGNDSYSYSYYLSQNPNEKDIKDWVDIKENQNDNTKLAFTINSNDIKNYGKIVDADNVYLYIKEVVTKGGNQKVTVSNSIKFCIENTEEFDIDVHFDLGDINFEINTEDYSQTPGQATQTKSNGDQTTASKVLPKTGVKKVAIIAIAVVTVFGVVYYIKYRKLNKDLK